MDEKINNYKEKLKKIETLLEQETLKRKKLEERLRITFYELINSNKENLLTLGIQISILQKAQGRAEFYKDLLSHDINNIFQSILSGIQLNEQLQRRPDKSDVSIESMEIVKEQIFRGAKLISNVRKLSQLEEGEISLGKVDICKILKKSIISVKSIHLKRNKDIQIDSVGKELSGQANDFLKDVFDNILINAVKHNNNPMVEIKIKISREQKNGINYLKMEFKDNGIGIDDTDKEKIFLRGEDKSVYGIGLGLSLVKKIINSYNGEIWVEDRVKGDRSKGSNFVLLIHEVD
jgi:signal transduction histidine kinase